MCVRVCVSILLQHIVCADSTAPPGSIITHSKALPVCTLMADKQDPAPILATQTESDITAQIRYEDGLAACYEAEYLLSMKIQEELCSGNRCSRYDYTDESELVASHSLEMGESGLENRWSQPGYRAMGVAPDLTEDCLMECGSSYVGPLSLGSCLNGDALNCVQRPLQCGSIHTSNGVIPRVSHCSDSLLPSQLGAVSRNNFRSSSRDVALVAGWKHPQVECVEDSHLEGPCRKKSRLQRPDF